ncbi:MAG TPA: aminoglycoside phosphotransferase family protein [Candidatus Acidoferrales bacterium]|nr:aminoglycoside phosphotransferase family protein [Candidatus Acidoferrales bacterium]
MDLAGRLSACTRAWHLRAGSRLDGGFRSEVVGCTTADGQEVVVKLTVTPEEAHAEAAALAAWERTGAAVRLIDADLEHSALLLERVRPATHLPGGGDPVAIQVAVGLLGRLHQTPPATFPFPALEQIYLGMEGQALDDADHEQRASGDPTRGAPGLERLDAARATAMKLCETTRRAVLLHGDFLDKNLLRGGAGYIAIDPIPCLGDPCSDVGFFAAGHPPAATILRRADTVAAQMDLDRHRARQWAVIWAVLQTCQAWREDQSELEACLSGNEFARLIRQ